MFFKLPFAVSFSVLYIFTYICYVCSMANKKYHVVDTGWAWVVFLASGGCHLIVGGVIYFVGVAHSGLLSKFNSNSVTFLATIGALFSGLACLAGKTSLYFYSYSSC